MLQVTLKNDNLIKLKVSLPPVVINNYDFLIIWGTPRNPRCPLTLHVGGFLKGWKKVLFTIRLPPTFGGFGVYFFIIIKKIKSPQQSQ